jgi:hypothetical protein
MLRPLTIAFVVGLLASGCVFISDDEYAERLSKSSTRPDTPCVESSWWLDADGDGYGDPDSLLEACDAPEGAVDNADDCDDADASLTPDTMWYTDADGDGYGGESTQVLGCDVPLGTVGNADDCNDANAMVNPGMTEDCATPVDDDCTATAESSGTNDEDADGCVGWFSDQDEDGFFGDENRCLCEAEAPFVGSDSLDCDDTSADVHPDAVEICNNGVDDDCDGSSGGCGLTGTQSLDDADATVLGSVAGARFGSMIATGDLTGDGIQDVVMSGSNWGSAAGRVVLIAGPLEGEQATADLPSWDGTDAGDKLGIGLAVLGDTDGDGASDLIIGAPGASGGASWGGGEAYVLLGPFDPSGSFSLLSEMSARVSGGAGGAYLGRSLGAVGDFNDDGLADVLVSLHGYDRSVLLMGPIEGDVSLADDVGLSLEGPGGTESGFQGVGAGDVDGDGLADVLIGARYAGSSNHGKVYLVLGREAASGVLNLNDEADAVFVGFAPNDNAGEALASSDVDGDGLSDLLIAAPGGNGDSVNAGVVYLVTDAFSGTEDISEAAWLSMSGSRAYGEMGLSMTHLLDADGSSMLAAGAPGIDAGGAVPGDVWIFDASSSGSLQTSDAVGHLTGSVDYGQAGVALAAPGDIDGDGMDDLLVGESDVDTSVTSGGQLSLFSGGGL